MLQGNSWRLETVREQTVREIERMGESFWRFLQFKAKRSRAKSEPHEADSDDSKGPAGALVGAGGILTELLKQKQPGPRVL